MMGEKILIVEGLIHEEGKILLFKQAYGYHLWTLPGGRVEEGETLSKAASREVAEETGLQAEAVGLIGIRDKAAQTVFVFSMKITDRKLVDDVVGEIEAIQWYDREASEDGKEEIEQFPAYIRGRFFEGELVLLPLANWNGYTGAAELFI